VFRLRRRLLAGALLLAAACSPVPVPRASPYHSSDADVSVTRIVHGSVILEVREARFVIDPWFHSGFVVRQTEPLGLTPEGMPDAEAVVLTHEHADHFDPKALADLAGRIHEVVAPPALHDRLVALGFAQVDSLDWWDHVRIHDVEITAVPARHGVRENGYVFTSGGVSVYYAGDTLWFPEMVDVATRFPDLDVALLPVGGRRFVGFRREMGPAQAAEAAEVLHARRVIPINYGRSGAFPFVWFARHPATEFVRQCERRGIPAEHVVVLQPGESWHYYR
jgi:L-ascorbate metabolism protein UlaG (beta-lactamase superfamily)